MKKLYVGNLPWSITEDEVRDVFSACGSVEEVKIITDQESGRSRGFAFVTMASDEDASKAISEINGREIGNRKAMVSEAREKSSGGGGFRGGSGGSRGSSGGGYRDRR
jgi:cold-inducible RNA-binding protein